MSTVFTTPTGEQLQRLAFYNELQTTYSEHRQVLGQAVDGGEADPFVADDPWQKLSMYQTWQNWLEANCTSFVDHTDSLNLFASVDAWRSVAGLNASGFSRYDKDKNLLGYGIAQEFDGIPSVMFEELQKGFDALRWTRGAVSWASKGENNAKFGVRSIDSESWAVTKSNAESNYNAAPNPFNSATLPHAYTFGDRISGSQYSGQLGRTYQYLQVSGLSTVVQHSASLFVYGEAVTPDLTVPDIAIYDDNGDGVVEGWGEFTTIAESSDTSHEEKVGDISAGLPTWCAEPLIVSDNTFRGYRVIAQAWYILKWNGINGFSFTL